MSGEIGDSAHGAVRLCPLETSYIESITDDTWTDAS